MNAIIYSPSYVVRLRNAEHFFLHNNIATEATGTVIKPTILQPVCNTYLKAFHHEDAVYKRSARFEETAGIKAAHEQEKKSYMGLKSLLETATYSETPAVKEAATSLLENVMSNYAAASSAPMTEASALITNLLQELTGGKHAALLALITDAATFVARLQRDNDAFLALYKERSFTKGEIKEEGTMGAARKATDQAFANMVADINVVYKANELLPAKDPEVSATLSTLISHITTYLRESEEVLARRTSGHHPGKDDPYLPDDEEEDIPGEGEGEEETPGGNEEEDPDEPLTPENPNEGGDHGPVEE